MTSRYDLWIAFLQQRDQAILALALLAFLLAGNWIMLNRWPIARQWMLYGGVAIYITILIYMGG